jgi:hypothetical protein
MAHTGDMDAMVTTVLRKTFGEPMFGDYRFNERSWALGAVEAGVVDGTESAVVLQELYRVWMQVHDED